jgi:hypothetical protein
MKKSAWKRTKEFAKEVAALLVLVCNKGHIK